MIVVDPLNNTQSRWKLYMYPPLHCHSFYCLKGRPLSLLPNDAKLVVTHVVKVASEPQEQNLKAPSSTPPIMSY